MRLSQTLVLVIVQGRISNVRWLEQAPWNARKVRGEKYFHYELVCSIQQANELEEDLDEIEGVWSRTEPVREHEPPHPAYAGIAEVLRTNARVRAQLLCLCFGPQLIDNDDCQEFCLLQQEKLERQLRRARRYHEADEVMGIRVEIERRGGEAYGQYKERPDILI